MDKPIVARVRGLLLDPKNELGEAAAESGDLASLLPYVALLVAIGPVARFVSSGLIGTYLPARHVLGGVMGGGFIRAPFALSFVGGIVSIAIGVAGWWLLATVIDLFAPTFDASKDPDAARKVAAFASTPVWVAGAFGIVGWVPYLGIVAFIALIGALVYGVMIGMWALPQYMGTPDSKALAHIIVSMVVTGAAISFLFFLFFSVVFGLIFATGVAAMHR